MIGFYSIFYSVDPSDVHVRTPALSEAANLPGWGLNDGDLESQIVEIISNQMPQDGSTNGNLPRIYDVPPDESDDADDADDDADKMVQDYVADLPLEAHVVEDHAANLLQVLLGSSINWDLPPRYDASPVESDDADDDADEMVQDYVAELPLEAHVVSDDVADAPQEAHVVPDGVANVPQEAHVVEDHVANSQRLCPICDDPIGVAFCCGHQFCVECGDTYSTCPICRDRVHIRFRVF